MDVADLLLGFGGFFHGRIKQNEVLVFGLRLRHAVDAAFAIPTVRDGQLGFGQILAGVVCVDQRVQGQPSDFEMALLDVVNGLIEQDLVGLLRVLGDRILVFLALESA